MAVKESGLRKSKTNWPLDRGSCAKCGPGRRAKSR